MSGSAPSRALQLELVAEASRAPSPHNTQPARWRFLPDGRVELWEDSSRRLPASDPTGRDTGIALGAAFEGLAIALSRHEWRMSSPQLTGEDRGPTLALVATARLLPGEGLDPLVPAVPLRRTWRGSFVSGLDREQQLGAVTQSEPDLVVIARDEAKGDIARWYDRATGELLLSPGVVEELRQWLRLTSRDPRWSRDGLTAECLRLSRGQALAAGFLLTRRGIRLLRGIGLLQTFFSEAAATRSAAAITILHRPAEETPFQAGRRFYRLWLQWTCAGLSACPMSALVDHSPTAEQLRHRFAIPPDRRIVSVFRVGTAPADGVPVSSRIPAEELLLTGPSGTR